MDKEYILLNALQLHCNFCSLHIERDTCMRAEHVHAEFEVIYVLHGSVRCLVERKIYHVGEGELLVIPGSVMHRLLYDNTPANVWYLQVDADSLLAQLYPEQPPLPTMIGTDMPTCCIIPTSDDLYGLLTFVMHELSARHAHYETAVRGALAASVVCMQRVGLLPDIAELSSGHMYQKMLPALRYAAEHLSEKITLDIVCDMLHMDKYNFCKYFKRTLGMTFSDYITIIRLRQAERLLTDSTMSITELAALCGFSSAAYLTRVFTSRRGCTPSGYRAMLREGGY